MAACSSYTLLCRSATPQSFHCYIYLADFPKANYIYMADFSKLKHVFFIPFLLCVNIMLKLILFSKVFCISVYLTRDTPSFAVSVKAMGCTTTKANHWGSPCLMKSRVQNATIKDYNFHCFSLLHDLIPKKVRAELWVALGVLWESRVQRGNNCCTAAGGEGWQMREKQTWGYWGQGRVDEAQRSSSPWGGTRSGAGGLESKRVAL